MKAGPQPEALETSEPAEQAPCFSKGPRGFLKVRITQLGMCLL